MNQARMAEFLTLLDQLTPEEYAESAARMRAAVDKHAKRPAPQGLAPEVTPDRAAEMLAALCERRRELGR